MDLHGDGDRDDTEELEEYLKEIQMVREEFPASYDSTRVSTLPPHDPSRSRAPIDSFSLTSAFENLSFGESSGEQSSADRLEPASMGVESQHHFFPRRPSIAGIMDQLPATSSATPHVANQQHNFQSAYVAPDLVGYTVVPPGLLSPFVNSFNQYSSYLQGGLVTDNLALPGPIIAADRIVQPGILSPVVNTNQYSNLHRGIVTNNLAFPASILAAERIVQPEILSPFVNSTQQYSNLQGGTVTNNLSFPAPILGTERIILPETFPPFVNSMDQYSNVGDNLGSGGLILPAETTSQPGSFSPSRSSLRDNIILARALQSHTDRIQGHLRDLLLRGRHQRVRQRASVNPQNPTEHRHQETRFHVSGQSHSNRVVGTDSNSNRPPVSRVHH